MCEKINFNVIEKNKYDNVDDITKYIQAIVNKLIVFLVKMMTSFTKTTKAKVSKIKSLC